jgi:hypothetical protein
MKVTLVGIEYPDAKIERGQYGDGSIALRLFDAEGPIATATVWLPTPPQEGCVWIKDWSENEGMLASLVAAGVVEATGQVEQTGFVVAHEARLL